MFQREYIFGCDTELYCVDQELSRAAMAALLDRILRPGSTSTDYFTDDDGHWAEDAFNRLAAADIVRGCGDGLACPDDPVTRGQLAALLTRAFAFPATDTDFFVDDDGDQFEAAINAIAAAGITRGCHDTTDHYCAWEPVFRDQAATMLARTVMWWEA
jgi:hypothetical protein